MGNISQSDLYMLTELIVDVKALFVHAYVGVIVTGIYASMADLVFVSGGLIGLA